MIVPIVSNKGGVGKTTLSLNIAKGLIEKGKKTILIEIDPQGNLRDTFTRNQQKGLGEVLLEEVSLSQVISTIDENIPFIPGSHALTVWEQSQTIKEKEKTSRIGTVLKSLEKNYDVIIVDTPPSLGCLTKGSLLNCDGYIIPLSAGYLSLFGVKNIIEFVTEIQKINMKKIPLIGILLNRFDSRKKIHKESFDMIRETYKELVFKTAIRDTIDFEMAISYQKSIFSYHARTTSAKEDIQNLVCELI